MFEERIKKLRLSLGLNQIQFGRKLFVSKQCISNWENGNIQPSIDMIIKISKTFSVSADYILGLSNEHTLDANGLTDEQTQHIQHFIDDLKSLQANDDIE